MKAKFVNTLNMKKLSKKGNKLFIKSFVKLMSKKSINFLKKEIKKIYKK